MKTLDEVLELLDAPIDRATVERYIAHEWLRPMAHKAGWYFEEIDIARIELVYHLAQDIQVNDHGMDVVLSLLDQLYGHRAHAQKLNQAIAQQSLEVQAEISMVMSMAEDNS